MVGENKKIVLSKEEIRTKKVQLDELELRKLILELDIEQIEKYIEQDIPMKRAKNELNQKINEKELIERNIKIIEKQLS